MADFAEILQTLEKEQASYEIVLGEDRCDLHDVRVFEATTPVRGSASRGNVYAEGRKSHRMEAGVDPAVCDHLSKTMLGPSNRFGGLRICARVGSRLIDIEGGLLSMSRTGGKVRLNMGIVDAK